MWAQRPRASHWLSDLTWSSLYSCGRVRAYLYHPIFIDENIGYKKFHLKFPPGEGLGPNLRSWDPVATVMWWPGTGLYLGEKEWTLPSLGSPPAIFGPRLPQFEAELPWSTGEALVGPTFQPWKEIIHLIYRDVQKYTDWILEILVAMRRACRFLKFGEGQLNWSWIDFG